MKKKVVKFVLWRNVIFEKKKFLFSFLFSQFFILIFQFLIFNLDNLINKMSIKYKFAIIVIDKIIVTDKQPLWNNKIFLLFKLKKRKILNFLIL